jgi:polar amino acid transport system permease protein
METIITSWPLIMRGLTVTLQVSVLVLLIGTVIGIGGGLALLYGNRPLRMLVRAYVDTIRGIPLLVLIFAIFYGLPALGLKVSALTAGVLALSVFCGAHVSEVIRGGIDSIPKGQTDAGKAIGLAFRQRLRYVIFPQAIGRILP